MNEGRYRLIGSTASPYAIKFATLGAEHRTALRPVLERTGCWAHLIAG
jgi:hypothetical protein